MTSTTETRIIGRAIPSLLSADLEVTKAFYESLGFSVSGEWNGDEEGADWIELRRDRMVLQFYREPPRGTPMKPVFSGTLYFEVTGLDELAKQFANVTSLEWGPERMDYGQKEFALRDPDGYLIAFFEQ